MDVTASTAALRRPVRRRASRRIAARPARLPAVLTALLLLPVLAQVAGPAPGAAVPLEAADSSILPTVSDPFFPRRVVVAARPGRFLGWPANNGLWSWRQGQELLVGFSDGPWQPKPRGHKVGEPRELRLARSLDGGSSWTLETPAPELARVGRPRVARPGELAFAAPDLAVKVLAAGGEARFARLGAFHVSMDRGRRWVGPYAFAGLEDDPRLVGLRFTSRTSVLPLGGDAVLVLLSAQDPSQRQRSGRRDKSFAVRSDDGGRRFRFLGWLVPWNDPARAVMPAAVDLGDGRFVAALRRRDPFGAETANWIDLVASQDGGRTWSLRSRVGEAGCCNGNPPALTRLRDGRLACAWADRSRRRILLRLSADEGRSWGAERVVRANPHDSDMGYPQIAQNHRGELVIVYYLATAERPHSFIEASLLRP